MPRREGKGRNESGIASRHAAPGLTSPVARAKDRRIEGQRHRRRRSSRRTCERPSKRRASTPTTPPTHRTCETVETPGACADEGTRTRPTGASPGDTRFDARRTVSHPQVDARPDRATRRGPIPASLRPSQRPHDAGRATRDAVLTRLPHRFAVSPREPAFPERPQPANTARATRSVPNAVRMARYSSPVAAITAE